MLRDNLCILRLAASLLLLLFFISDGDAGSPCLPREDIYPCTCTSVQISKKSTFTVVTCSHVPSTSDLFTAFIHFRRMDIDRFVIIDSFLRAKELYGDDADKHQTLPQDWITRLKVRELEIVDSAVASCFMCDSTTKCRNQHQTHMSVVNSSHTGSICTICKTTQNLMFSWTGCMSRLKFFSFTGNSLSVVEKNLFPEMMRELIELSLSSNKITKVGKDAFKNLPKLSSLDLSHNLIQQISGNIFGDSPNPQLKFLDLSWNQIAILSSNILTLSPSLATLNLNNNQIRKLEESAWKDLSRNIKTINLTDNPICCDCDLAWFNASLQVHTAVLGTCEEPERFEASVLRQASRLLSVACGDEAKRKDITKCV